MGVLGIRASIGRYALFVKASLLEAILLPTPARAAMQCRYRKEGLKQRTDGEEARKGQKGNVQTQHADTTLYRRMGRRS